MAASYSTNSATGPTDLVQKLVTWLVAQGWTQDASASYGSGWRAHLHKNGQYVNLRAIANEAANISTIWGAGSATAGYGVGLYLGTGYNGSNAFNAQAGGPTDSGGTNPIGAGMFLNSGAIAAYHFLDDGNDHITVVVDRGSGLFSVMGWGPSLVKTGYTNDFWYFYGSVPFYYNAVSPGTGPYPGIEASAAAPMSHSFNEAGSRYATAFVRVDSSLYSGRWVGISDGAQTTQRYGYTGKQARCAMDNSNTIANAAEYPKMFPMFARGYQSAFVAALLLPLHCFLNAASARWIPLGYPPTVFHFAGIGHGFTAATVYQVGGLDYLCFPNFAVRKAA
jgi:hypothetical protein